ncbi:hypothetical protein BC830DRAFT_1166318 [Chytriomyces sp. MP71]|nr:hypothetical protein BC830DRAFT_1166318 [Chytriomyces sp. MP71]
MTIPYNDAKGKGGMLHQRGSIWLLLIALLGVSIILTCGRAQNHVDPTTATHRVPNVSDEASTIIQSILQKSLWDKAHFYEPVIPKVILRTFWTNNRDEIRRAADNGTDKYRERYAWFETWDKLNPTHTQLIFTDFDSDRFVMGHFSKWVVDAYFRLPRVVLRADMARYFMLYIFGGLYTDMDTECLVPIREWTTDYHRIGIITGSENLIESGDDVLQYTIGAAQFHPFIGQVIYRIVEKITQATNEDLLDRNKILDITGPGIYKQIARDYLQQKGFNLRDMGNLEVGYQVFGEVFC